MKHLTILLISIATLCLFTQVLTSNRFLANDPVPEASNLSNATAGNASYHAEGPKPEGNNTHGQHPINISGNASGEGHPREQKPHVPARPHNNESPDGGNHTEVPPAKPDNSSRLLADNNTNNEHRADNHAHNNASGDASAEDHTQKSKDNASSKTQGNETNHAEHHTQEHHAKPDNSSRLLAGNNDTNASRPEAQPRNNASGNASAEGHHEKPKHHTPPRPHGNESHDGGNHTEVPPAKPDNSSRLLAGNNDKNESRPEASRGSASAGKNATHAVRPRSAAPKLNETSEAGQGRKGKNNARKGGKGKAHHVAQGENGEENLSEETRKLIAKIDKALRHGKKAGKGQKKTQNQAHNSTEHLGASWNGENGEEAVHQYHQRN